MAWVDVVVLVILLLYAVVGCARGFLKTLLSFFGTLVTLVVSILLAKYASGWFESWFGLNSALTNWLYPTVQSECEDGNISGMLLIFAKILISKTYNINDPDVVKSEEFMQAFADSLGGLVGTIVTVIILFVIIRILLFILSRLFDKITRSKVFGSVDKVLGFVLGILKGGLGIFVVFGVIYLLSPVITPLGDLVTSLADTNPVSYQIYLWATQLLDEVFIPWFSGGS